MNHGHGLGALLQRGLNLVQVEGSAPFELYGNGFAISLADLGEPLAELAIGYGYDLIVMADEAGNRSIHAHCAAAGHYYYLVLGLEELLE